VYVSVKVRRDVKDALAVYVKSRGLSLSDAIADLLDKAHLNKKLERITCMLENQDRLLIEILDTLQRGSLTSKPNSAPIKEFSEEELPSYMKNNPWLSILAMRGREP